MKKIKTIGISEKELIGGITEDEIIRATVLYRKAVLTVSALALILFLAILFIISSEFHIIIAIIVVLCLYIFALLALKSYYVIQKRLITNMIYTIKKLQNGGYEQNGTTIDEKTK